MNTKRQARAVIIGGGITGLAAAHALRADARFAGEVVLLEARARVGGNVRTTERAGFVMDEGPDAWLSHRPHATALARTLGLEDRLMGTTVENRRVYLAQREGSLEPLPEGLVLGVPTRLAPFITTPLLSIGGKLRAAFDLVAPEGYRREVPAGADESVGSFLGRRLGPEVVERLAAPLLAGIFATDLDSLSLQAALPQLVGCERNGGVIRGMRKQRGPAPSTASPFTTLRGGMRDLVDALASNLGSVIRTNVRARSIEPLRSGDARGRFAIDLGEGEPTYADHIVIAGPAYLGGALVRTIDPWLAEELSNIPYRSLTSVFLGYREKDVPHPLDGTGHLVPPTKDNDVIASTWVSSKWENRAPRGHVLLRVLLRGNERMDEDAIDVAAGSLREALGVRACPVVKYVARFDRASAQPLVGHAARVRKLRERTAQIPGLHIGGSGLDGFGLADCVRQGIALAAEIAA